MAVKPITISGGLSAADQAAVAKAYVQGGGSAANITYGGSQQNLQRGQEPDQTTANAKPQSTQNTQDQSNTSSKTASDTPVSKDQYAQEVKALQDYLVNTGHLTAAQVATGPGIYGPQTTAAVAQLYKQAGVQAPTPQELRSSTPEQLTAKYQGIFGSTSGQQTPQTGADANSYINSFGQSTDPVFGAMSSSLSPIMSALTQTLQNINNPALTGVSLQQEYNQLSQQYGLPQMQSQLVNYQNIMNGTEDDIRSEITSAGGTATESQVLGMTAARNKVILKQYNALATNYQAAQTNVSNMMQYAATDQATQLQRQTATAGIVENMASIESQMMQMGMTMQQHTTDNLNKIVTNVGYTGLASQAQDNPDMLAYYEKSLGLSPGALSNPKSLQQLETLRQQQVALGAQRVQIQMYNAGLGGGPTRTNSNTPGLHVNDPNGGPQQIVATQTTGSDSQGRPYSFSGAQAKNLLAKGATVDPGTNNIIVPKIGYYIAQQDGSYRLSLDPKSTEGQFVQYSTAVQNAPPFQPVGGPSQQRMARNAMSRQANAALKQYVDSPTYKNVSAAATYLSRLDAGLQNPGSIGDPDIIDSLVKINTGGQGAITEQQYQAYAQGQTWRDRFAVFQGKVVANGGTLSPDQRNQIRQLANDTISNYRNQYEVLYVQAMKNLQRQGIPLSFGGNLPDWSGALAGATYTDVPTQ